MAAGTDAWASSVFGQLLVAGWSNKSAITSLLQGRGPYSSAEHQFFRSFCFGLIYVAQSRITWLGWATCPVCVFLEIKDSYFLGEWIPGCLISTHMRDNSCSGALQRGIIAIVWDVLSESNTRDPCDFPSDFSESSCNLLYSSIYNYNRFPLFRSNL